MNETKSSIIQPCPPAITSCRRQRCVAQHLIERFDEATQVLARFDSSDKEKEISFDPETTEEFGVLPSFEHWSGRLGCHRHFVRMDSNCFAKLRFYTVAGRDDFRSSLCHPWQTPRATARWGPPGELRKAAASISRESLRQWGVATRMGFRSSCRETGRRSFVTGASGRPRLHQRLFSRPLGEINVNESDGATTARLRANSAV